MMTTSTIICSIIFSWAVFFMRYARCHNDKQQPQQKLRVVTYTDNLPRNPVGCATFRSAALNGIEIEILGIGTSEWDGTKDRKLRKIYALNKFVTQIEHSAPSIRSEDLILFCDASDVVFFGGANAIINAYRNITAPHKGKNAVVFGTERACWPYMNGDDKHERMKGGRVICKNYPTVTEHTSFKFLNSGLYMTTFGGARTLLAKAMEILEKQPEMDDQLLFNRIFLAQHGKESTEYVSQTTAIVLDTQCVLFQNGHNTHLEHQKKWSKPDRSGPFYNTTSDRVLNSEFGTEPLVIHFNGGKAAFVPLTNRQHSSAATSASSAAAVKANLTIAYQSYVKMYKGFKICGKPFGLDTSEPQA